MCMIVWLLQRASCCCSSCCYVRGICTQRTVSFSLFQFLRSFPCLFFFVANCFQRKLLHAQSYEQTERERDAAEVAREQRQLPVYMYVYRSGWQAFARHWLCKRQTVCAACEKLNEAIRALRKDQEEPPNGMACNVGGCMVGREILASCIEELFRQFMCENGRRKRLQSRFLFSPFKIIKYNIKYYRN